MVVSFLLCTALVPSLPTSIPAADSPSSRSTPDVFHNKQGDGEFYLYYTDNIPDAKPGGAHKQIGVAVAEAPLGPFKDKSVLATDAIDAHLFRNVAG